MKHQIFVNPSECKNNADNIFYLDDTRITLYGNHKLILENQFQVSQFDEDFIKIRSPKHQLSIIGHQLKIKCFSKDEIIIEGYIKTIDFIDVPS